MAHESAERGLHKPTTIVDAVALQCPGPPLRTADLASMTGFTVRFIQMEIESGHIKATRAPIPGARWLISRACALDYLRRLGLLS